MRIALSGSSGSIGRIISDHYQDTSNEVIPVSFRSSAEDILVNKINYHQADCLVHLASKNSNLADHEIDDEIAIAQKALDFCKKYQINNLLFFSTSQVYGSTILSREDIDPQPTTPYAKAKLACEGLLTEGCKKARINLISLRLAPFLDLKSSSKISRLINFTLRGWPIPFFSKAGINSRSFLSKHNLLIALDTVLGNLDGLTGNRDTVFNISNPEPISTNKLLEIYCLSQRRTIRKVNVSGVFERLVAKIPILKGVYLNICANHSIDTSKFAKQFDVLFISINDILR